MEQSETYCYIRWIKTNSNEFIEHKVLMFPFKNIIKVFTNNLF